MSTRNKTTILQVFNGGKPCGWLGKKKDGYWFHYSSTDPHQSWVSLLMPPYENFYEQVELFPVFAQHIPLRATTMDPLEYLHQSNGKQMGALTFADPDSPVVRPPARIPPHLQPGQSALIAKNTRKNIADTIVYNADIWPEIQLIRDIKEKSDPQNRLHALRWTFEARCEDGLVTHPRPDIDLYQQNIYGLESFQSILNLGQAQYQKLIKNKDQCRVIFAEVVRTYCKYHANELILMDKLFFNEIISMTRPYIIYRHKQAIKNKNRPEIIGIEYLPSAELITIT